ncbi:MAG: ParB/RepB/Spo0J family partition protein [Thermodesulfobacteriota bacterium]
MAKVVEYRDVSLDDLEIGKGQARTQDAGAEIDELAKSIEKVGLLQPIVVSPLERDSSKYEILTGQRRFLAHKKLGRETISAAILDERVSEDEAKAISITENLLRRKLTGVDLKNGITFLYKHYGTIKDVVASTGLPQAVVSDNVKYPRLLAVLKEKVDKGEVDINVAVKAQDAVSVDTDKPDSDTAVALAVEMQTMTGAQRKKLIKDREKSPDKPIDEVIESAKTGDKIIQIVATLTQDTHKAVQKFASDENINQDDAAVKLIEESLTDRGLLT